MLITSMYAILVDELQKTGNLTLMEAVERADEVLQPAAKYKAAANRRAFAHLLPKATG